MCVQANYIVSQGLGGAMFWTLDFDDFQHDVCGQGTYPLIGEVSRVLQAATPITSTVSGTVFLFLVQTSFCKMAVSE